MRNEMIIRYLQDAIAAERNFESQLRSFAKAGNQRQVQELFLEHADETQRQHEMLTKRLEAMGETPSGVKSFLAHLFGFAPTVAQVGHEPEEKNTQHLIIAFAVENSEVAMYEALANTANAAGDMETEHLARTIQVEERRTAEKVWNLIPASARDAYQNIAAKTRSGGGTA